MRFQMTWDRADEKTAQDLEVFERQAYKCRTLVPLEYEEYFRETAQHRTIALSVEIEDPRLGQTRALHVLVEGGKERAPVTELQVENLQEAYRLVRDLATDSSVRVDNGLIRTMNSLILRGLSTRSPGGLFRGGPAAVIDARNDETRYRPPRPEHVPTLMDDFVQALNAWMDEGVPGPIVAALAHFGLISIHPFQDGNGRTARLLTDMILAQTGNSADGMLSMSEVIYQRLDEYYDTLRAVQGDDFVDAIDASDWVRQHMSWLREAAELLEEKLVRHRRRLEFWRQSFGVELDARQQLGLLFAAEVGPLSSPVYARLTGTSPSRAKADLNTLIGVGALELVGRGPSTRYRISPRWEAELPRAPLIGDEDDARSPPADLVHPRVLQQTGQAP